MNKRISTKNFISVEKSFISRQVIAQRLEEKFGLSDVRCQLISATMRDVYHVLSKEHQYIFYIYRHNQRTLEEINSEWDFVEYLHREGVEVVPAICGKNDKRLLTFEAPEGLRYGVLTAFIEGRHLRQVSSVEAVREYGKTVARIHLLSDDLPFRLIRPSNDIEFFLDQMLTVLETVLYDRSKDIKYLQEAATIIRTKIEALPKKQPLYGVIHGDVIRANAQVSSDGRVTILDFDLCGPGWRGYDIATYLGVIRNTPDEKNLEEAFRCGYEEVRPLTNLEFETLPLFEGARQFVEIGIPAMNIYHWGRSYLSDYWVNQAIDRIKRCLDKI